MYFSGLSKAQDPQIIWILVTASAEILIYNWPDIIIALELTR